MIALEEAPAAVESDSTGIIYLFCEDCGGPDVALCGSDIRNLPMATDDCDEPECVVCADLSDTDCPHRPEAGAS